MKRNRTESGFSLVEVILTFAILAIATTALGLVEVSNARRTQELKARDIAFARGQAFMERILRMPFGAPDAVQATALELDRVFGSDLDVREVTLTQLQQRDRNLDGVIDDPPIRFELEGVEDAGVWEIFIDNDLDGNGVVEDVVDGVETREGRSDILRIEVRRNDRTVIRTVRSRSPQERDAAEGVLE